MKKIIALFLTGIIFVVIPGCATTVTPSESLKIGLLPAEPSIPIIVAKENGFFEEENLKVDLITFNSPNDRNAAVQAGEIDAIIADIMTSLTFFDAGIPMKITSDINEDFKLLTSPGSGIDSFEKLDKKDVSIIPNFVLEYIMDEMAERNNIEYETVVIPSFTARFEALLQDQISGVIFTEPQASMLMAQGANLLASSKEYGMKAGTILFDENTLESKQREVEAFYHGYNKAIEYMNEVESSEYSDILGDYGFPDAIATYLSSGVKYEKAGDITVESFESVLEWTKSKELIKNDYEFVDISDFNFIK